jgi:acyl-coenzyme A synthetase/AMP-(fatty) acid ligase
MLMRGGTIYFAGREPTNILQYLAAYKVQGLALSPHNLSEYLQLFQADPAFESPFEVIVCQGARLSRALSDSTRARLCSNLYTSYGSTETTTVACGPVTTSTEYRSRWLHLSRRDRSRSSTATRPCRRA